MGKVVFMLGLFPKILVLSSFRLSQNRTDELKAFQGDSFSDLFFHGYVLLFVILKNDCDRGPMSNPLKTNPLAMLCTFFDKIRVQSFPVPPGYLKRGNGGR
jgi:hypothetical protein